MIWPDAWRGIPQAFGFDGLKKEEHGLVELPAFERFGLIWVRPSVSDSAMSIDAWLAPMAEQLASLDLRLASCVPRVDRRVEHGLAHRP